MVKNYINIAIRNLKKQKAYTIINLLGLSIGLVCCLFIAVYVNDELKYDQFHANSDRIYRVTREFFSPDGSTSLHLSNLAPPFAEYFRQDFPQMEKVTRMANFGGGTISYEDKLFDERGLYFADQEVLEIFDFDFIAGDPATALTQKGSVIINETIALKYFNSTDVLGEVIRFDDMLNLKVTGVFKEMPENSHLDPELVIDFGPVTDYYGGRDALMQAWGSNNFGTYFLLAEGEDIASIERTFSDFLTKHIADDATNWNQLHIQKMTDIHLKSNLDDEQGLNSDITYVYIFSGIGLLILVIACINYMNLATARSSMRAKEVGMRKVMGAGKRSLIRQFLIESIILVFGAVLIALLFSFITMPFFREFTERSLVFTSAELWAWSGAITVLGILIGVGSGIYPAFFLSSYKTLRVLKGDLSSSGKSSGLRKALVIIQFSISAILIASTIVIFEQINYMSDKNLGYSTEQVLTLNLNGAIQDRYDVFKNKLLEHPAIVSVGSSRRIPSGQLLDSSGAKAEIDGEMQSPEVVIKRLDTGYDFLSTYDMEMTEGRWFDQNYASDDTAAFVLNEKAVEVIGWQNPVEAIGKNFSYGGREGKVIGVSRNVHFESLRSEITPVVMFIPSADNKRFVSIKIASSDVRSAVEHVENQWAEFSPQFPISYRFLDDRFETLYQNEALRSQLFTGFSFLAIFLACLGLLGLASFIVAQKRKEVSIRKVLGASVQAILVVLSRDFLVLVGIAIIIGAPVSWIMMSDWLEGYAYRINLGLMPFIVAGIVSILIALGTISLQTVKAALDNPVNGLRDE